MGRRVQRRVEWVGMDDGTDDIAATAFPFSSFTFNFQHEYREKLYSGCPEFRLVELESARSSVARKGFCRATNGGEIFLRTPSPREFDSYLYL